MPIIVKGKLIDKSNPMICVPIRKTTRDEILDSALKIAHAGVPMVEWRADYYEGLMDNEAFMSTLSSLKGIFSNTIFLLTIRSSKEGGAIDIGEAGMNILLDKVSRGRYVDIIDLEYFYYKDPDALIRKIQATGTSVILSHHDFIGGYTMEEIENKLVQMESADPDIVKLALSPQTEEELGMVKRITSKRASKSTTPYIVVAMGEIGQDSRINPSEYGGCISFAAFDGDEEFGQLSYSQLLDCFKR